MASEWAATHPLESIALPQINIVVRDMQKSLASGEALADRLLGVSSETRLMYPSLN